MNDGVKILLERIKTNPEEFMTQEKWGHLIQSHKMFLNEEDAKALDDALNGLMQQRFTEKVMEELLDPKSEQLSLNLQNATLSAGTTRGLYSNGIGGNATLLAQQQLQTEHMKAHIEALKVEDRTKLLNKKATTIFGRLFNYT